MTEISEQKIVFKMPDENMSPERTTSQDCLGKIFRRQAEKRPEETYEHQQI